MFGVQELATASQFGIGVVALVFNNHAYANVRRDQMKGFGGRLIGSDLKNPDFVKLAEAFGIEAARVSSPEEFGRTLDRAVAANAPWLIEIDIATDSETNPWKFVHPPRHPGVAGIATVGDVFAR